MYRWNDYENGTKGIVEAILDSTGISQAELARRTRQVPQSFNEKLRNNTMRAKDFARILDELGYEIVVLKK